MSAITHKMNVSHLENFEVIVMTFLVELLRGVT